MTPIVLDEGTATAKNFLETRGFPSLAPPGSRDAILKRLAKLSAANGTILTLDSASANLLTNH